MQAIEHRESNDVPTRSRCLHPELPWRLGLLLDPLAWSCLIEVGEVLGEHTAQGLLAKNYEMI